MPSGGRKNIDDFTRNLKGGRAANSIVVSDTELWLGTNITGPFSRCSKPCASIVTPGNTSIVTRPHIWASRPITFRVGSVQGLKGMLETIPSTARSVPLEMTQTQSRKEPITVRWG